MARPVFKTGGGRIPSPVGSIPIYSRQLSYCRRENPGRKERTKRMLPPKQHKAYCNFYDTVRNNDALDARTTVLIGLAAAMARECRP